MKLSIKKILGNLNLLLTVLTILLGLIALSAVSEYTSYNKIENLQDQKRLIHIISTLGREDLELSSIQYRGKSTSLHNEIAKLHKLFVYDIQSNYIFDHAQTYKNELDDLKAYATLYTDAVGEWYKEGEKNLDAREKAMLSAQVRLINQIDSMIEQNISYEKDKFVIQEVLVYLAFLLALSMTLWYSRRLAQVYKDIQSLFAVDLDLSSYVILTHEVEAISKRMNRKPATNENPAMIDQVTQINNYKGMVHAYGNRKSVKDANFTGLCVFEIDHFKELDKRYPKEFTQAVLKKIAFMISLHEQPNDVIARIDYCQFVVIFSRPSKELALKDCETIRKSVEETGFKVPRAETLRLSLSGGYITKPNNKTLDEAIAQAREILKTAQENGRNRIAQLRDHAEKFN